MKNKKRVLIISVADLRHMTCSNFFCEYFAKRNIEFDIICMQRYSEKSKSIYDCNIYQVDCQMSTNANAIKKIKSFLVLKKYVKKHMKECKYDFVVIWGENAAWLLGSFIEKHSSYCVNVRDYLEGKNKIFVPKLKRVLTKSVFNTVPSPNARNYLGVEHLLMLNQDYQVIKSYSKCCKLDKTLKPIHITYMGLIHSYINVFKKFLLLFKNDDRFIIKYYGPDADEVLKVYADEQGISNAIFGGSFSPDKTHEYLEKTDIINSVYGNDNSGVVDAVGVKESYAPLLHIPVISDCGSLFSKVSEEYGFGKGVILNDDLPDVLYEWYINLDEKDFDENCDKYCKWVEETNTNIENQLNRCI